MSPNITFSKSGPMASPFNGWPDDYQQLFNTAGIKVAWYAPFASQDFGATS